MIKNVIKIPPREYHNIPSIIMSSFPVIFSFMIIAPKSPRESSTTSLYIFLSVLSKSSGSLSASRWSKLSSDGGCPTMERETGGATGDDCSGMSTSSATTLLLGSKG